MKISSCRITLILCSIFYVEWEVSAVARKPQRRQNVASSISIAEPSPNPAFDSTFSAQDEPPDVFNYTQAASSPIPTEFFNSEHVQGKEQYTSRGILLSNSTRVEPQASQTSSTTASNATQPITPTTTGTYPGSIAVQGFTSTATTTPGSIVIQSVTPAATSTALGTHTSNVPSSGSMVTWDTGLFLACAVGVLWI